MRVVRIGSDVHWRGRASLAEKGSFSTIFRGLGLFTEAALLFCGSYLLAGALLRPLEAGELSVVGGGLALALATWLLLFLFWPSGRQIKAWREPIESETYDELLTAYGQAVRARMEATRVLTENDDLPGPM